MAALTNQLSGPAFEALCADLRALSADPTLAQVRAVMVKHGISSPKAKDGTPSKMAAKTLKEGPFARYLEKIESGRKHTEALVTAARGGTSHLDALEEVAIIELQDHVTSGETIDVKFLIGQLSKLRLNLSMREDSRRKQTDLERKLRETEKKIEVADRQLALRDEQISKLERQRTEWEDKRRQVAAQVERANKAPAATADEVRAAAVAEIDRIMGLKPRQTK